MEGFIIYIFLGFIVSTFFMLLLFGYIDNLSASIFIAIVFFFVINILSYRFQKFKEEKREERLRNASMQEIQNMTGEQFELYLKSILKAHGYTVQTTSRTGDFGADLILQNQKNEVIVVQAKRYKSSVGIKAVQEVLGAKSYYDATYAWVMTNSYFTKAAKELAAKSDVLLMDRQALLTLATDVGVDLQGNVENSVNVTDSIEMEDSLEQIEIAPAAANEAEKVKVVVCPQCKSSMVLRKSKHGEFYGCSKFPKCRGTLSL